MSGIRTNSFKIAMLFCTVTLALASCGPLDPGVAADRCEARARAAAGPTGEVGIGYNTSSGAKAKLEIGITSDYLLGKDPQLVYEHCVRELTGQGPIRPLVL